MADGLDLLESHDGYAGLRNALRQIAAERGDWAGLPMPIEGCPMVVEPKFPNAGALMELVRDRCEPNPEADRIKLRNTFWSWKWRSTIIVAELDGKIIWQLVPGANHFKFDTGSLSACDAWGIEQEGAAVSTLATLVRHRQFKQYMLTGMLPEHSERSGVHYIFRRLKPTIALSTRTGETRILAALCMHPIGYYRESWAGAMCPTDDVIAHLMLMRGDEKMFWRRCNQHAAHTPEAGI